MRAGVVIRGGLLAALAACGAEATAPVATAPVGNEPAPTRPAPETAPASKDSCASWAGLDTRSLPALPETPYTATFEQVWRIVLEKHFDPTLGCQDWPARRLEFGQKLAEAADATAAYATMNALLGTLKQSHFKVVPPSGAAPAAGASGPARAPIHVRVIDGEVVVVDPAVGGVESGVPRGAVLVAIDDRPLAEITAKVKDIAQREDEVAFQTMLAVEGAMHGGAGAKRKIRYRDPKDDAERSVEVACVMPAGELVTIGNLHDIPTTVTHRMMPGTTVGHLAFNYWMLPMIRRVEAAMQELRAQGMTALVLDLRGNPGGVGAMSIPVARMLLKEAGSLGKLQFRDFAQEFNVADNPDAFTGPVIVLVDEGTASTSEIFAAGLRDLGRVKIYGARPSAGAALPSMIEQLEGGAMLQYVVGDYHSSKGAVAEGDGVRPDVIVPETRADFIAGRDPVLAAAAEALSTADPAAKVKP